MPVKPQGQSKQLRFDELFRVLNFCRTVETEGTDPFDVDVKKYLATLRRYQPKWQSRDELLLDAEALAELAKIIELQEQWIRDRSHSFYIDPALLDLKLRMLEPQRLAAALMSAWHPITGLDRLTPERLQEGLEYWHALLPLGERGAEFPIPSLAEAPFELDELIALNLLAGQEFDDALQAVLNELQARGRVGYYEFIFSDTFAESVLRAYLTSYLVTEGRAELELNPLEETVFISPRESDGIADARLSASRSIPLAVSYEDWGIWKRRQKRNHEQEQSGS
jgi:hypothetical protein